MKRKFNYISITLFWLNIFALVSGIWFNWSIMWRISLTCIVLSLFFKFLEKDNK